MAQTITRQERFWGVMLGTAVGDSVGLPAEGLTRQRSTRWFRGQWRQRFVLGWGMVSDDTDHAFFVCQCLLARPNDARHFADRLGWCLRGWIVCLPAGVGLATLKACARLWVGMGPQRSGVWSAGNGPAMRAAPIGARFAGDEATRRDYVRASTRLTHTDPKAEIGAQAIADIAAWTIRDAPNTRPEWTAFATLLRNCAGQDREWNALVDGLTVAHEQGQSVSQYADSLGLERGVGGYIYYTVPVVLYAWYRHWGDYAETRTAVLDCGGDTDTTGAIVGALAGAVVGEQGIPANWINHIVEWPRTVGVLRSSANRLAAVEQGKIVSPVRWFWPGTIVRNMVFLLLVLLHGFRRLAPPY